MLDITDVAYPLSDWVSAPKKPVTTPEFVRRMYQYQSGAPANRIQNEDGTFSTHKMMSFEQGGKYLAAPTIVN